MVWSDKAGLLTLSCGCLVPVREPSSSYVGDCLCMWAVVFAHWQCSSYVGSHCHAGALILYMCSCLHMGAGGCGRSVDVDALRLSRVVVVVVVMGCGHRVTIVDALWTLWMWLWLGVVLLSSSIDRVWVARGCVVVLVH